MNELVGPPLPRRRWDDDAGRPRLMCSIVAPESGPYCRECKCSHSGMKDQDLYCGPRCELAAKRKASPEWYAGLGRSWHQSFARQHGYFWIACHLCGRFYGGHEPGNIGIMIDYGLSSGVCPRPVCAKIADELNILFRLRHGESLAEAGLYRRRKGETPPWLTREHRASSGAPPVRIGWRWPWGAKDSADEMADWLKENPK